MIWIVAQGGIKLVLATAVVLDAADSPPRYELWAQATDSADWRLGTYANLAQAERAFNAIVEAVKSGAKFVDLRPLEA